MSLLTVRKVYDRVDDVDRLWFPKEDCYNVNLVASSSSSPSVLLVKPYKHGEINLGNLI